MPSQDLDLAPPPRLTPAEKLMAACELHRVGVALKRRSLREADPRATDEVIERRLRDWLAEEVLPEGLIARPRAYEIETATESESESESETETELDPPS